MWLLTALFGLVLALAGPAAAEAAQTFYVRDGGTGTDCTEADPCATVQEAIEAHRVDAQPGDVIDVGPGTFVGNAAADQPEDDGLVIRGALDAGARQTTLRGEDLGADDSLFAFLLGGCAQSEVKLRDIEVDTVGADPEVGALTLDGGSDLVNVHASNQPNSEADAVAWICGRGTSIERSQVVAEGDAMGIATLAGLKLQDSTVSGEAGLAAIGQFSLPFGREPHLNLRRSHISLPATSDEAVVLSTSRLTLDSSLVTGGGFGVMMSWEGARWQVNNSTVDAAEPGVADPVSTPSLLLIPSGSPADVAVDSSILVDGIRADDGEGTLSCAYSDLPDPVIDPVIEADWVDDCPVGEGTTNTTTDPADLFEGGDPFDFRLSATSPAIDSGQPGAVPAGLAIRDLAGNPRRAAGSAATCPQGIRDKGAYEYVGPPCSTALPEIIGGEEPVLNVGLGSTRGQWNNFPTGFERQWHRCDQDGDDCAPIPGKNRKGYTPKRADLGHTLRIEVVATNAAGDSEAAISDPSGVVSERLPTNTQLPEIMGGEDPLVGQGLNSTRGEWANFPTDYLRQWLRCDAAGDDCAEITEYRARKVYIPRGIDVGHTLRVRVIASNSAGESEPATSEASGVVVASTGHAFWTNGGSATIGRANLNGSGVNQSFITGASNPHGITIDDSHVYWANADANSIGRANLDGSAIDHDFITGASSPRGVAVDDSHVYWANAGVTKAIGRANLDGSGVDQTFINVTPGPFNTGGPHGVAVDGSHLYWTNWIFGRIERANLDGSGVNQTFITGASSPRGVAVDGSHIYWANTTTGTIGRANLNGSAPDQSFIAGAAFPDGVAVDGSRVYWANGGDVDSIGRANLDGSDADQEFIPGASSPRGLAVDDDPSGVGG